MGTKQPRSPVTSRSNRKERRAQAAKPIAAGVAGDAASGEAAPVSITFQVVVCVLLAAAVLAVFGRTFAYGFITYDDGRYVYENPILNAGLSAANVAWALTTFSCANWHPLTWLSYLADVQLFGVDAGEMHAVNALLHLLTAGLLFLAFVRMTGRPWRSALVAGLFAVHPLHVESVAWIAERKDVLSACFMALTLFLYGGYAKVPSLQRYVSVALAFALSLMAKPMAVTLPLVLLLLDFWPLGRLGRRADGPARRRVILEKIPLLAMTAISCALTFQAQRSFGAVVPLEHLTLPVRAANAIVSYAGYIVKMVWPAGLAVFYPPHRHGAASVLGSAALVGAVTLAAVKWAGRRPYLLTGWLWYVGMLVPAIGIVQVGDQAMADRYTYLPMVGLSIAVIWMAADAMEHRPGMERGAAVVSILGLAALAVAAARQASYWEDSRTLYEHALAATDGNYVMANDLGAVLGQAGPSAQAEALYRQAIALRPGYADAHANLGHELLKSGRLEEGRAQLAEAVRLDPMLPAAQADLGFVFASEGSYQEARTHLAEALRLNPANAQSQNDMCFVLLRLGRPEEASAHCTEALNLDPGLVFARINLAKAHAAEGKQADAERELNALVQRNPGNAAARQALVDLQDDLQNGKLR